MIDPAITDDSSRTDSASSAEVRYRSFRATKEDRSALLVPPLQDAELSLKDNLLLGDARKPSEPGSSRSKFWSELRKQARGQLLEDAVAYTSAYRNVAPVDRSPTQPVVMAGHQPTLFHPGVWFKNYALHRVGVDTAAHAVNLVIDNDVAASRSIRVPTRDALGRIRSSAISYDVGGVGMPFEQAKIRDLRQFDAFENEVKRAISPLVSDPLITSLWPHAREAIRRCEIAGCALAQARHAMEGEIGWDTLEIPLGVAVRGLPFARFIMEIIDQFERFHHVYNHSADHYRAWHGIRSSAHPVPNLAREHAAGDLLGNEDWWELPLWVYGNDSPLRRPVWVRRTGNRLQISDRAATGAVVIEVPADNRDAAAAILADAASPEWKLRPRALMTTMFARLVLSDLFLHGIGGGKYDQLADRIIRQFFDVTPPSFHVVSATVRLPGQKIDEERGRQIEGLQRQLRDTRYQGERFAKSAAGAIERLIEEKTALLAELHDHASVETSGPIGNSGSSGWSGKADWQKKIDSVNQQMSKLLEPQRSKIRASLDRLRQNQAEEAILASREWSFCLFSLQDLLPSFQTMMDSGGAVHFSD